MIRYIQLFTQVVGMNFPFIPINTEVRIKSYVSSKTIKKIF